MNSLKRKKIPRKIYDIYIHIQSESNFIANNKKSLAKASF